MVAASYNDGTVTKEYILIVNNPTKAKVCALESPDRKYFRQNR